MTSFILTVITGISILTGTFLLGKEQQQMDFQVACVAKYDYMPHNQVGTFCTKLLKFSKDEK